MGKCVKNIALSVMAAIFGAIALTGPVFATPTPDTTTPETTETTTVEQPAETPAETETTTVSCYDQVGSLGWIICPGAGLFGNVIDGAYDLLTQIIEVNPIPTDNNSPTHVVWSYFKDITNSLFIVFLLVIILSQLTGFGINNYGIKKALPRIVIAAILVNLSYIICTVAVDLSNILGNAFQAFFVNVQNIAIENGTISNAASGASVAGIVAAMIGVGASATFAAGVAFGGAGGVIWMLLPVLLSGLLAVISAVITMAARQALIFLLVMVSPLALIAYTLPNTEKWYKKWVNMLAQMLFFYPMFSILYGASQLAGLVIITSATNWLGVVLGIAVKILPLFMSIPLMRMSGSVLGKISGIVNRAGAPLVGTAGRYSASKQMLAKQKQLAKRNPALPSTRLAQYLDRQRARRAYDIKELTEANINRGKTKAQEGWFDRKDRLTKRGIQHLALTEEKARNDTTSLYLNTRMDEGFNTDGSDKRVRARDLAEVTLITNRGKDNVAFDAYAKSYKRYVDDNNARSRAELIHESIQKEGNKIHQNVLATFNVDSARYDELKSRDEAYNKVLKKFREDGNTTDHMTNEERAIYNRGPLSGADKAYFERGSQAINYTLADAISSRRKLDKAATDIYYELYDDTPAGPIPGQALAAALENGDKNSMTAAIKVMAKRGDHKDIMDILRDNSSYLIESERDSDEDRNRKIGFQKEINDVCLSLKADNQILWAWAKSNMIRRGKYNSSKAEDANKTPLLDAFIDFDSFINGSVASEAERIRLFNGDNFKNDKAEREYGMISMEDILTNVRDGKIFGDADRTMYNYFTKGAEEGKVNAKDYYFTAVKHLRASASCGKMDGEQLAAFNNYYTMNFRKIGKGSKAENRSSEKNDLFYRNKGLVYKKLRDYFKDMNATQLVGLKTATLMQFNDALIALDDEITAEDVRNGIYGETDLEKAAVLADENRGTVTRIVDGKEKKVSKLLLNLLANDIHQLNSPSAVNQRSSMNIAVREMLKIDTEK